MDESGEQLSHEYVPPGATAVIIPQPYMAGNVKDIQYITTTPINGYKSYQFPQEVERVLMPGMSSLSCFLGLVPNGLRGGRPIALLVSGASPHWVRKPLYR